MVDVPLAGFSTDCFAAMNMVPASGCTWLAAADQSSARKPPHLPSCRSRAVPEFDFCSMALYASSSPSDASRASRIQIDVDIQTEQAN